MIFKVEYYEQGDGFFSMNKVREELVSTNSRYRLKRYIENKSDDYGNRFKREDTHGFQYVSRYGGVKIERIKVRKI